MTKTLPMLEFAMLGRSANIKRKKNLDECNHQIKKANRGKGEKGKLIHVISNTHQQAIHFLLSADEDLRLMGESWICFSEEEARGLVLRQTKNCTN
jgi:hypothetical protein